MKDKWGPYDFYRQFNLTYPEQYKLDYAFLLGTPGMLGSRTDEEFLDGFNDHLFLIVTYFTYRF